MTILDVHFGSRIVVVIACFVFCRCSSDDEPVTPRENLQTGMLSAINELRISGCQCGNDFMPAVHPLRWNDTLQKAADNHARDMYSKGYFSHLSQDGKPPITRAMQVGYEGEYVGENIARNFTQMKDVIEGWKASESHCKTMMDTLYNEMGASSIGGYWVLDLGRAK
jgi:uncharacterized protein YkwD